jgi:hypothetical protein
MLVYTTAIQLEIGGNWMNTDLRKATDRRNTPIFELEDVPGRYTCHIRGLPKVKKVM